jgi:hypothetical protein
VYILAVSRYQLTGTHRASQITSEERALIDRDRKSRIETCAGKSLLANLSIMNAVFASKLAPAGKTLAFQSAL